MPWRDEPTPYFVLVSELMLQQTQVSRVIPKFLAFTERFPNVSSLADAPLSEVLKMWSGLGYNRRAKFLHQSAKQIVSIGGKMPEDLDGLMTLPGVGKNTAGAIMNYAYAMPTPFIETNIRTVYFSYFFADVPDLVDDKELMSLVEQTLDREHPREWFWALMDYGTYLKKNRQGVIQQSSHYKKQAPLKGSLREMRGRIVRVLGQNELDDMQLRTAVSYDERYDLALSALQKEGLVEKVSDRWRLTGNEQHS